MVKIQFSTVSCLFCITTIAFGIIHSTVSLTCMIIVNRIYFFPLLPFYFPMSNFFQDPPVFTCPFYFFFLLFCFLIFTLFFLFRKKLTQKKFSNSSLDSNSIQIVKILLFRCIIIIQNCVRHCRIIRIEKFNTDITSKRSFIDDQSNDK